MRGFRLCGAAILLGCAVLFALGAGVLRVQDVRAQAVAGYAHLGPDGRLPVAEMPRGTPLCPDPRGVVRVLASRAGIDGTVKGSTGMALGVAGRWIVTGLSVRLVDASGVTRPAKVGLTVGASTLLAPFVLTGLAADRAYLKATAAVVRVVGPGESVTFSIETPYRATRAILAVDVLGYEI